MTLTHGERYAEIKYDAVIQRAIKKKVCKNEAIVPPPQNLEEKKKNNCVDESHTVFF
jgi:hypothetical protein